MDTGDAHALYHGLHGYVPDRAALTPAQPYALTITCLWAPVSGCKKAPPRT